MNPVSDEEDHDGRTKTPPAVTPAGRVISVVNGRIDSRELFLGTREIMIAHGGEAYRLRLTAQNKLILTK